MYIGENVNLAFKIPISKIKIETIPARMIQSGGYWLTVFGLPNRGLASIPTAIS